jgi:hypothetical protein
MTSEAPERPISDDEIRDWAGSTGRPVGTRGRVEAKLRAEYEAIARDLGGPPAAAADLADVDAEPVRAPKPAREETQPRPVPRSRSRRPRSRFAAFLGGNQPASSSTSRKKAAGKADKPRVSLDKFAGKLWGYVAGGFEHVNVPVARCMAWQSPYVGLMVEDALKNTLVDRILQPIARSEEKFTTAAAVIAMPFIVAALQAPGNQPDTISGAARNQVLTVALKECVEAQLETFGSGEMAARVQEAAAEREAREAQVDKILTMIFFDLPAPQTPAEAEQAERDEMARRAEAAAGAYGPTRPLTGDVLVPGLSQAGDVLREVAEEARKVRAAEAAAGRMAAAGDQAAAQQRAAVANVQLGTARL